MKARPRRRLIDLPLWRLLVALNDAEQSSGPSSPVTRELAEAVQTKLRGEREAEAEPDKGATCAAS